ncbi:MAG: hypothetical protein QMB65_02850, partial [Vicingaceae bacterium]
YNEQKPDDSNDLIFGSIINNAYPELSPSTGSPFVDILAAISSEPVPKLAVLSSVQTDTINGQNGNEFWEPGETIEILPLIKNYWGPTEDVRVGISFAEFEDTTKATIVQNEIQIGSISAYASLQDLFQTLKIQLSDNIANNVDIRFDLTAWSGPDQEYLSNPTEIVINVKNSTLLFGLYETDLTLYPDTEYLVSGNLAMAENTTLTILPGVELYVSDDVTIIIDGDINAIGTTDSRITFAAENNYWNGFRIPNGANSYFKYCIVKNIKGTFIFNQQSSYTSIEKSIFSDNTALQGLEFKLLASTKPTNHDIIYSNFIENISFSLNNEENRFTYNNFINNFGGASASTGIATGPIKYRYYFNADAYTFGFNNVFSNTFNDIGVQ